MIVMSPEPLIACITDPAQRNRPALKNACVTRWKTPPSKFPVPTPANMKPSWLTVEYASTFLKSFWAKPMMAANSAVAAPTRATIASMAGART